jgi:(E)-2-((N-methylformamido)methylene)succinate hydrolase
MMNVTDPERVSERLLAFLDEASAEEAPHVSINGECHD